MPREKRVVEPGAVYHLISRCVAQEWLIGDYERQNYLELLGKHISRSDWSCIAYAIMSNHLHLGLVAGKQPLASWIQDMHRKFAEDINARHKRIGAVLVRGPKTFAVHDERVVKLIAYIHRNPVRGGVAWRPSDTTWTSHRAYLGLDQRPEWLDVPLGLARGRIDLATFDDAASTDMFDRREPSRRKGRPPKQRLPEPR